MGKFSYILLFLPFIISCKEESVERGKMEVYEGPVRRAENLDMYYSEESLKKAKLSAGVLLEFKNGDREFPDGIYVEFFDENGEKSSTLKGNYAYFTKADNLWKATGDVEVQSLTEDQQLNSEELFWKPDKELIYTDKFVIIRLQNKLIHGNGLESNQDFTDYTIKNPVGDIQLQ